jgi:hypothetical protein
MVSTGGFTTYSTGVAGSVVYRITAFFLTVESMGYLNKFGFLSQDIVPKDFLQFYASNLIVGTVVDI